jgi:hypothetical protein
LENPMRQVQFGRHGAIEVVIAALELHHSDVQALAPVLGVLENLLCAPENQSLFMALPGVPLLSKALVIHMEDERIGNTTVALGRLSFNPAYLKPLQPYEGTFCRVDLQSLRQYGCSGRMCSCPACRRRSCWT